MSPEARYPAAYEREFCASPADCSEAEVLVIGSGIGMWATNYLKSLIPGSAGKVVLAEAGGLDFLTHLANTGAPRYPVLRDGKNHVGGKLIAWGMSTPRPPAPLLAKYPYPVEDLDRRFAAVERQLGIPDQIPYGSRELQACVEERITQACPELAVRPAPLAIDRYGYRWSPVTDLPDMARDGIRILSHFSCSQLVVERGSVKGVRGRWAIDGHEYLIRPRYLVLAVGVEGALPLVRQLCPTALAIEAADHIRIDCHSLLKPDIFGRFTTEELGVAVLLVGGASACGVPYHLEVKVAPRSLWRRFMPSGDNLRGREADETIYAQIQVIAAMHDRLPVNDLLNVGPESTIPPVMSSRDAAYHGGLVEIMGRVAAAIGVGSPSFSFRPLLTNHHVYGAFRVGKAVSETFRFRLTNNVYILPPASYVDVDDDANPTLKSLVLSQYAMDEIAARLAAESGVRAA